MTLALSCKVLGIYLYKIKFKIACSLNDIQIPTKVLYDHTWQNFPHMPLALYWVWSSSVIPVERCFMLPRSKLTYTPQINSCSYSWNTLKHVSITHKWILHALKMISLAYFQKKKMNAMHWKKYIGTHEGPKSINIYIYDEHMKAHRKIYIW